MLGTILSVIKSYMGTGIVTVVFLLCLAYLVFFEKDKVKRCVFVYMPVVVITVFLCPLTYKFYAKVSEAVTYYRLIWLIPVTPVIAYACTLLISNLKGVKRNLLVVVMAAILALSGKLIYTDANMVRAQNIDHMPDVVIHICDALHVEGREVRVVVPEEFTQFVRQYDPCICLAYGREFQMGMFVQASELRFAMIAEDRDPNTIGILAAQRGVHYIVVRPGEEFEELPTYYEEFMKVDGFTIYKNTLLSTDV